MNLLQDAIEFNDFQKFKQFLLTDRHLNRPVDNTYPILKIIASGNDEFIKNILFYHVNLNIRDENGSTPLIKLIIENKIDLVKMAIFNDVDIDFPDTSGRTPISYALEFGLVSIVELLIDHHANLTLIDNAKRNPLFYIALIPNDKKMVIELFSKIVKRYIDLGGDINLKDKDGLSALDLAVEKNNTDLVEVLLFFKADYTFSFSNTLDLIDSAVKNNNLDLAYSLLDVNKDKDIVTAISHIDTSSFIDTKMVEQFEEIISACNATLEGDETAAALQTPYVQELKAKKANTLSVIQDSTDYKPEENNEITEKEEVLEQETPINLSEYHEDDFDGKDLATQKPKSFEKITEIKYTVEEQEQLARTAPNRNLNKKIQEEYGDDYFGTDKLDSSLENIQVDDNDVHFGKIVAHGINERYKHGMTKLIMAAASNNLEAAEKYIELGADVNKRDLKGASALMYAAKNDNVDLITLLLNHHATIDIKDEQGFTAIVLAVASNNLAASKELLKNNANANSTIKGKTLLMIAASKGNLELVKTLMEHSAIVRQKDWKGNMAEDYARAGGFKDIIAALRDHRGA